MDNLTTERLNNLLRHLAAPTDSYEPPLETIVRLGYVPDEWLTDAPVMTLALPPARDLHDDDGPLPRMSAEYQSWLLQRATERSLTLLSEVK